MPEEISARRYSLIKTFLILFFILWLALSLFIFRHPIRTANFLSRHWYSRPFFKFHNIGKNLLPETEQEKLEREIKEGIDKATERIIAKLDKIKELQEKGEREKGKEERTLSDVGKDLEKGTDNYIAGVGKRLKKEGKKATNSFLQNRTTRRLLSSMLLSLIMLLILSFILIILFKVFPFLLAERLEHIGERCKMWIRTPRAERKKQKRRKDKPKITED